MNDTTYRQTHPLQESYRHNSDMPDKISQDLPEGLMGFSFYAQAEFALCRKIYDFMRQKPYDSFIQMPDYAVDYVFANRLSAMLKSPKALSMILDAQKTDSKGFIDKMIAAVGLEAEEKPYEAFGKYLAKLFQEKRLIVAIILGSDRLTEENIRSLYEFSSVIHEKYPKLRKRKLFRFVFIGTARALPSIRKYAEKGFGVFEAESLTLTDVKNVLILHNEQYTTQKPLVVLNNTELENRGTAIFKAVAGSFVLLRKILPIDGSVFDKKTGNSYTDIIQEFSSDIEALLPEEAKSDFKTDSVRVLSSPIMRIASSKPPMLIVMLGAVLVLVLMALYFV